MKLKNACLILFILSAYALSQNALIWYPGGNAATSAQAVDDALDANGVSAVQMTGLPGGSLTSYNYIFICLGVYPNAYALDATTHETEISQLVDYLDNGGNLYMEGGDTWAWDTPTELHFWFNLIGEADGDGDLGSVLGASCFQGTSITYDASSQYIDRLAPYEGSLVLFTNDDPAYACGVGYNQGGYRTLGVSFEFGSLASGSHNSLMSDILSFYNNTGCFADMVGVDKPAPLNLLALSGYDGAVPLIWDAPPGQAPLSSESHVTPSLTPSFTYRDRSPGKPGRVINRPVNPLANRYRLASYQAVSYNIYRSTSLNGTYSQIASNINRQYYRDKTVTNGTPYFYRIRAVYSGSVESEGSVADEATPSGMGNFTTADWKFITPILDGQIEEDEWLNAATVDITAPGEASTVTLYSYHFNNYLYIAVNDAGNTSLDEEDQIGIYFDKDHDFSWPDPDLDQEGSFWLYWNPSSVIAKFRGLGGRWPMNMSWADQVNAAGVTCAISMSTTSGNVQYEVSVDLSGSKLNITPPQQIGLYLYGLDMPSERFSAHWPNAVDETMWSNAWMAPALYGTLDVKDKPVCPWIYDDESITGTGSYEFNEWGDGRKLEMDFTSVSGSGKVTVRQDNECVYNPITSKHVGCVWGLTAEPEITSFETRVTFHYTDQNVIDAGLDESKLRVHRWTGTGWESVGGVPDENNNTVSVDLTQFSDYTLFEEQPINIDLVNFQATQVEETVIVEWRTGSETNLAGYNLFRSSIDEPEWNQLNETLIMAQADGANRGADYVFIDSAPVSGKLEYMLESISLDGTREKSSPISIDFSSSVDFSTAHITEFDLLPNYPNPFNPVTQITYQIPREAQVDIRIYNMRGRLVKVLVQESQTIGTHSAFWDGTDADGEAMGSGLYIIQMIAGSFTKNRKITLLQ